MPKKETPIFVLLPTDKKKAAREAAAKQGLKAGPWVRQLVYRELEKAEQ